MKKLALLAALGLAVATSGAEAAVFTVTYTGTVAYGSDATNYLGAGTALAGSDYVLQFTVDTSVPSGFNSYADYQVRYGSSALNPIVQTSFTLNDTRNITFGNTPGDGYDMSYGQADRYDEYSGGTYDQIENVAYDYLDNGSSRDYAQAYIYSFVNEIVTTANLDAPLDYQVAAGDNIYGYFNSMRYASSSGYSRNVQLTLNIGRVVVAPFAAAVPEPATWAMLIAGFGLTGAALRRRRPQPALAATA